MDVLLHGSYTGVGSFLFGYGDRVAALSIRSWQRSAPLQSSLLLLPRGRPWHFVKLGLFARGSPTRGAVERSETERLYEGKPDREPLLDSTSPSALTRCHLPYRGEALAVPAK